MKKLLKLLAVLLVRALNLFNSPAVWLSLYRGIFYILQRCISYKCFFHWIGVERCLESTDGRAHNASELRGGDYSRIASDAKAGLLYGCILGKPSRRFSELLSSLPRKDAHACNVFFSRLRRQEKLENVNYLREQLPVEDGTGSRTDGSCKYGLSEGRFPLAAKGRELTRKKNDGPIQSFCLPCKFLCRMTRIRLGVLIPKISSSLRSFAPSRRIFRSAVLLHAACLILSLSATAQTVTTYSGAIRDLSQNVVTSGQVTFELRPSYDSTISGFARFVPSTITCSINQATAGASAAVRATNSVTISGLTGHTFVANDIITVSGMTDSTFNGTFTIGSTTATSITYPQTAGNATTGSGVIAALRSTPGPGSCTVTMNTALNPSGTSYRVCIQPNFISPGSCFNDYAVTTTKDLTTVVPTPTTSPAFTFVDLHSAQTIDGNKTFTGSTSFTGSLSLGALSLSSLSVSGASTLTGNTTVGGTLGVTGASTLGSVTTSGNVATSPALGANGGALNVQKTTGGTAIYNARVLDSFGNTNQQIIGFDVEQLINPPGNVNYLTFGQVTEVAIPTSNTANFTGGDQTATYGSVSDFGSGTLNSLSGVTGEGFNAGPATATLVKGVSGTANCGGVVVNGIPNQTQTPTNNGNCTNLRAIDGTPHNFSSGTVANAVGLYAEAAQNTGGGTITNGYGLFVADQTAASNNWAIKTGVGKVEFGSATLLDSTLQITSTAGIGTAPSASVGLLVLNPGLTGTFQFGFQSAISTSSSATSEGDGITARADTAAAAFTQNLNVGVHSTTPTVGAGSAITEWDGVRIEKAPTAGTKCSLVMAGSASGTTCFNATPAASGTITFPAATGTVALDQAQDCGTTTTCATTNISSTLKIVKGSAPLVSGTPSTATVTGFSPAFTSSSSFVCTATNATTQANPIKVVNASSSSITLTGPNTVTDTINYICLGT